MKRSRTMIGLLAAFGMLLNAALIVRHQSVMLQAVLAGVAISPGVQVAVAGGLEADLRVICHGGSETTGLAPSGSDDPASTPCPLCMGLADAVTTVPAVESAGLRLRPVGIRFALPRRDDRVEVQRRIRPPGRAPPMTA